MVMFQHTMANQPAQIVQYVNPYWTIREGVKIQPFEIVKRELNTKPKKLEDKIKMMLSASDIERLFK
jgi:hypothetical protein